MKRGLTPSSQAERQRPEPVHVCAHRAPRLAASPPPRRMSNTSPTMAAGSRMSIPAGPAVGQTSTHRAQRVQRSRISLTLRSSEAMNASPRSIIVSLHHVARQHLMMRSNTNPFASTWARYKRHVALMSTSEKPAQVIIIVQSVNETALVQFLQDAVIHHVFVLESRGFRQRFRDFRDYIRESITGRVRFSIAQRRTSDKGNFRSEF